MKNASLTLVRRFRASPEEVFAACTDPAILARWFGPKEWVVSDLRAEARVGGTLWFRMEGPPGTMAAEGTYEVVEPPHRLVHSWRWTEGAGDNAPDGVVSRITYDIKPDGSGTVLRFTQEGLADQESADSHESGWGEALDKLAQQLDGEAP